MTRMPDFVVLGQGKAGTSLIYRVFEQNPDTGLSRPKELMFFSKHFDKGLEWYQSHFEHLDVDVPLVGEVSPAYLMPAAINHIHDTLGPQARLIYVLRHPIDQAYSRYLQNVCASRGAKGLKFDAHTVLTRRLRQLHAALKELYAHYDPANILQLFYEQDIDVSVPLFEAKICTFLNLPQRDLMARFRNRGKVNAGVMPRFVYGGPKGVSMQCDGESYWIPAGELVFCAQPRNTKSFGIVSPEEADAALKRQSVWMESVTEDHFAELQAEVVHPFAQKLERDFGLDLSHWRGPARGIVYSPAPPPPEYLAEGSA